MLRYLGRVGVLRVAGYFLVCFVLVSFPFSVSIFYKLLVGFCMYSCGFVSFLAWVFYNVSEQFFLVKYLISVGMPRSEWMGSGIV